MKDLGNLVWPVVLVGAFGCGRDNVPKVPLVPVTGTLTVRGEPAAGLYVILHPIGETKGIGSAGQANADGTFILHYRRGGVGAVPGNYKVTLAAGIRADRSDVPKGKKVSFIPPEYGQTEKTVLAITIPEDGCALDIDVNFGD